MLKIFTFKNYIFKVNYENKVAPASRYPRIKVSERVRAPHRIWLNNENKVIKEVIYPRDLWFTQVKPDDPVENFIIDNCMCLDWTKIEIKTT
jgi:hypothetical protein